MKAVTSEMRGGREGGEGILVCAFFLDTPLGHTGSPHVVATFALPRAWIPTPKCEVQGHAYERRGERLIPKTTPFEHARR